MDNKSESSSSKQTLPERGSSEGTKASKFEDPKLDPVWLYDTLRKEICSEARYYLEDNAKLRAVTQGTANYEEFRKLVLGAHIQPLDKKDRIEGCQNNRLPHVVWNTVASKKASREGDGAEKD